jgi:transcription initiation factor TFIIIB Brf1 subunit/transcription initiation factor TFIIB
MINCMPLHMEQHFSRFITMQSRCDLCKGSDVVADSITGDKVCRACGHVLASRMINEEAEWRTFVNDDRSNGDGGARCSMRFDDEETSVFVGGSKADREMLQRTQSRGSSHAKRDAKILEHLGHVSELSFKLGLNDAVSVSYLTDGKVCC